MGDGRVRYARNGDMRLAYQCLAMARRHWPGCRRCSATSTTTMTLNTRGRIRRTARATSRGRGVGRSRYRAFGCRDGCSDARRAGRRFAVRARLGGSRLRDAVGYVAGGPVAIAFTARYPERVRSISLYQTAARFIQDPPDFPWGLTVKQVDAMAEDIDAQ